MMWWQRHQRRYHAVQWPDRVPDECLSGSATSSNRIWHLYLEALPDGFQVPDITTKFIYWDWQLRHGIPLEPKCDTLYVYRLKGYRYLSFVNPAVLCYCWQGAMEGLYCRDDYLMRNSDSQASRSSVLSSWSKRCYRYPRHGHKIFFCTRDFMGTDKATVQYNSIKQTLLPVSGRTQNNAVFFVYLRITKNAGLKVIAV
jgi:hypothetical protein